MTITAFIASLPPAAKVKASGPNGWSCRCPAHEDREASLSIGVGKEGRILLDCFAGCTAEAICHSLNLTLKDLMPDKPATAPPPPRAARDEPKKVVATYNYLDENGVLLYRKLRYEPKTFRIQRPDPEHPGLWLWGLNGTRKILYRLPELIQAINDERPIFCAEGERDVDVLMENGFAATCNPNGAAEEWSADYTSWFPDAEVIVIADKDDAGRTHAKSVADSIRSVVKSVKTIELPDRDGHKVKDAADWFAAGGQPAEFDELVHAPEPTVIDLTEETWGVKRLLNFDTANDPNAVIGFHDGKTTRYLCKGYGAWPFIGQSGIGKSSLAYQQGYNWALGKPFMGMTPVRPQRILMVQNENDEGDSAEATQGIIKMAAYTETEIEYLEKAFKTIRCRGRTGQKFCDWLLRNIDTHEATIVYLDPFIRFAGIDVSRQDQVTRFLNDSIDPVLAKTGVVLLGTHHTGKPKAARDTAGWSIYDHAYAGIGSSELVNWARAIGIVRLFADGVFELMLAKRGPRAWATHPNGDFTTSIYLKHADDRSTIYWQQIDPPLPDETPRSDNKGGRPNKITEIACSNLHSFLAKCTPEGEPKMIIAKRLEFYLSKENQIDANLRTCQRAIEALVANQKLFKTEASLYVKGPQA